MKHESVTREEWEARKAKAPAGLVALNEKLARLRDEEKAKERAQREYAERQLAERRTAFEACLADLLQSESGEWLSEFREPDYAFCGPHTFSTAHQFWFAQFDLRRVGHHRIRVELIRSDSASHEWKPACRPFAVLLPAGDRPCLTLAEAVRVAGEYVECPF